MHIWVGIGKCFSFFSVCDPRVWFTKRAKESPSMHVDRRIAVVGNFGVGVKTRV